MRKSVDTLFRITLLTLALIFSLSMSSQTIAWTGHGVGNNWFTPGNWNLNIVPTIDHYVTIDSMHVISIDPPGSTDTAFAKSIKLSTVSKFGIEADAVFYIDGATSIDALYGVEILGNSLFSSSGQIIIKGARRDAIRIVSGQISNHGSLTIVDFANTVSGQAVDIVAGSSFTNNGNIILRGPDQQTEVGILNHGTFLNNHNGFVEINAIHGNANCFGIENYGLFTNRGILSIDSVETVAGMRVTGSTAAFINEGTFTTTNILDVSDAGLEILNGAILSGEGTLNCHLIKIGSNNSRISTGTFSGKMTINGDLFLDDEARFISEIQGNNGPGSNTGHDQMTINGNLTLENNGLDKPKLEFIFLNGYTPEMHQNFAFIKFTGSRTGLFDNSVDKPDGYTGWGSYYLDDQILFRRYCSSDTTLIEVCNTSSCQLWSGYYDASTAIDYSGPHLIPLGESVQFQSVEITISNGFEVKLGAVFEITPGPCNT